MTVLLTRSRDMPWAMSAPRCRWEVVGGLDL
jgi:hypothetical protein